MVGHDEKTHEQRQDELDALNASITKQGSRVRALKKEDGSPDAIAEAIVALQNLKLEAAALTAVLQKTQLTTFSRKAFDDLVVRKMFVIPSFEIHGGVKGLFDLGPPACALKVSTQALFVGSCAGQQSAIEARRSGGRERKFCFSEIYLILPAAMCSGIDD